MDFKKMGEGIGLDEDEFLELTELYLETSYSDLNKLLVSVKESDIAEVVERAHSLKGSSGNMGFVEIYEIAKEIEMNARDKVFEGAEEAISTIREQLDFISEQIKAKL